MNSFYLQGGVDVSLERDWTVGMQAIYNHSAPKPGNALSWTEVTMPLPPYWILCCTPTVTRIPVPTASI